ncbi:hypothetical protein M2102_002661 [Fusobacterium sp. PH5-7]|uniref:hypothetical protein n=1 Tax=Fusobacterium sp. PH5-7 TaxID=2940528 RepID=UPI0024735820|nr:hypothetical protein [Fusobacterium sp. PH5-7]MDH6459011.1 hypothetical protein [Fusobacterium sp. PH5-7]
MKYFFKTLISIPIIGILLIGIFLVSTMYVIPLNKNLYSLAHIDKMKMLQNNHKKIVLIGGSNVAFGFNSNLLKKEFIDYDIINTGIHASIGIRYPLKEIESYLKSGDILIIFPEYEQFEGGYGGTPLLEICLYKKKFKNIEIKELLNSMKNIKGFIISQINNKVSSKLYNKIFVYDRRGFNENGDYVEHHKFKRSSKIKPEKIIINKVDQSILDFFYNKKKKLEKNRVKVIFCPPVLQKSSAIMSIDSIKYIEEEMRKNKTQFVSNPENYFLEDKYFYDTIYHLNKEGAEIRTKEIIKILKKKGY